MAEKKNGCFVNILAFIILLALIAWGFNSCSTLPSASPDLKNETDHQLVQHIDSTKTIDSKPNKIIEAKALEPNCKNQVTLGFEVVDANARFFKEQKWPSLPTLGVMVVNVLAFGPGQKSKLQALDLITMIGDMRIKNSRDFAVALPVFQAGATTKIEYWRLDDIENGHPRWQKYSTWITPVHHIDVAAEQEKIKQQQQQIKQQQRKDAIEKLMGLGVFVKFDPGDGVVTAWIGDSFMPLPFDSKTKFCSLVYAYFFADSNTTGLVILKEQINGKDVGEFTTSGLKMK